MSSDRYPPEDMLLEFGGVAGRSGMTEGSEQDHLYFFQKNKNTGVLLNFVLLLLDVIMYVFKGMYSEWKNFSE